MSKFGDGMALKAPIELTCDTAISMMSQVEFGIAWRRIDITDVCEGYHGVHRHCRQRYEDTMLMAGAKRLMEALETRNLDDKTRNQVKKTRDYDVGQLENKLRGVIDGADGDYFDGGLWSGYDGGVGDWLDTCSDCTYGHDDTYCGVCDMDNGEADDGYFGIDRCGCSGTSGVLGGSHGDYTIPGMVTTYPTTGAGSVRRESSKQQRVRVGRRRRVTLALNDPRQTPNARRSVKAMVMLGLQGNA